MNAFLDLYTRWQTVDDVMSAMSGYDTANKRITFLASLKTYCRFNRRSYDLGIRMISGKSNITLSPSLVQDFSTYIKIPPSVRQKKGALTLKTRDQQNFQAPFKKTPNTPGKDDEVHLRSPMENRNRPDIKNSPSEKKKYFRQVVQLVKQIMEKPPGHGVNWTDYLLDQ